MDSDKTQIYLNRKSVQNNIRFLKQKMGAKVLISSVVKANAYGHGIEQMVPLLEEEGIHHFSVFDFKEALRVYKCMKEKGKIMIMGWVSEKNMHIAIEKCFEFFVFNLERFRLALKIAKQLNTPARIHIEVETGMNRSGLNQTELEKIIDLIKENKKHVVIEGFCSHLAGAESISNHYRIQQQIKKYNKFVSILENSGLSTGLKHIANSAAAFSYQKTRFDMVRIGIMQYGFWPSTESFIHYIRNRKLKKDPLNRILSWKSRIMALKDIDVGEYIGYGISYLAQKKMKSALIPVGYANGYSRSLSNKGRLLIGGKRCTVVGVVNMNMLIADVTDVFDVEVGDEVVIIGKQGELEIKVNAFSNISEKLNYEILAHLPEQISRIVTEN